MTAWWPVIQPQFVVGKLANQPHGGKSISNAKTGTTRLTACRPGDPTARGPVLAAMRGRWVAGYSAVGSGAIRCIRCLRVGGSLTVVRASDFVRHLINVSNINRLKVVQTFLKQLRVDPNATQAIEGHPFHIHLIGILHFSVLGF